MNRPLITVLTATWNRASTLPRLKASLEAQTYSNFEWLIVDDGSTDETIGLIEQWQLDSSLAIILLRRQNGGKHRSVNDGMRAANGRWIFIVDSDDRLPNRAIENITIHLPSIEAIPNVAGLSGLKADFSGQIIGESFPAEMKFCDAISLTYRYGIRADKADVYKKEVLASFPFPEFEGERFLTEAVIWYRIANAGYALLLTNEVLYECEYRGDGLSAHSLELRIANPIGTLLFYKEIVGYDLPYRAKLREASNYMRFCRHYRRSSCFDPRDLEQVSHAYLPPKLRIPASIIGNAAYLYDQLTLARSRNTRNRCNVSASMPFDTKKPIRVLHVINSLSQGGAERFLASLLPRLKAQHIENMVLVLNAESAIYASVLEEAGIPVYKPGPQGFVSDSNKKRSKKRAQESRLYSPSRVFDVLRAIRCLRPDIVHAHLAPSFHWCALASLFAGKPVYITTEHASKNRRMSIPFFKWIEKACYARYASIICVSPSVAQALSEWLGIRSDKLQTIVSGIDIEQFLNSSKPAPEVVRFLGGRTGIAMTARFVPVKDHPVALEILDRLPERYALILIGDGPGLSYIQDLAAKMRLEQRCLFLGSREDIPNILAACHLYIQTSQQEGLGLAVAEAMAAGLPVVVRKTSGLFDLVDGAGLFFEARDIEQAVAQIISLENRDLREKMVLAESERIKYLSIERVAYEYGSHYRKILRGEKEAK